MALVGLQKAEGSKQIVIIAAADKAWKAYNDWVSTSRRIAKGGMSGPTELWMNKAAEDASEVQSQVSSLLDEKAELVIDASRSYMVAKKATCSEVAGANPAKPAAEWHLGLAANTSMQKVLDTAKATLMAAAGEKIDLNKRLLKEAMRPPLYLPL